MDFTDDLSIVYADFSVNVTHTAAAGGRISSGLAIFDQPGVELINGEILATDYSLRYPATTFPDVVRGDLFAIANVNYRARAGSQPASVDGLEHIVPLERV